MGLDGVHVAYGCVDVGYACDACVTGAAVLMTDVGTGVTTCACVCRSCICNAMVAWICACSCSCNDMSMGSCVLLLVYGGMV